MLLKILSRPLISQTAINTVWYFSLNLMGHMERGVWAESELALNYSCLCGDQRGRAFFVLSRTYHNQNVQCVRHTPAYINFNLFLMRNSALFNMCKLTPPPQSWNLCICIPSLYICPSLFPSPPPLVLFPLGAEHYDGHSARLTIRLNRAREALTMKPTLFTPIPAACLALILLPSLFLRLSVLYSSHVDYNFWITVNKEFLKTESGSKPGTVVCHNLIDFLVRDPFPHSVPSVRSKELPESYNFYLIGENIVWLSLWNSK